MPTTPKPLDGAARRSGRISGLGLAAGLGLLLALSACQMTDSEIESLPPDEAGNLMSDQEAYGAGPDTPSEFSDATGAMGI